MDSGNVEEVQRLKDPLKPPRGLEAAHLTFAGTPPAKPVLSRPVTLAMWRRFFRISGANILYCLSALSILYGIAQIITPVLAKSDALGKTLPCIGALHVYELALLGVLALIVLWRNVTDDAVFLVILIALFLTASAIAIDSVANDNPWVAVLVGVASLGIAALKLWVMRRAIVLQIERLLLIGLGMLLAWNFLMSSSMAFLVKYDLNTEAVMRAAWLVGWLVMLAGGILMLLHAARTPTGAARRREASIPFLRTPAMAWTFALALFLAGNVRQCALTYIFDLPLSFGDFLPVIVLGALVALELMRNYGKKFGAADIIVALVPLVVVFFTVRGGAFIQGPVPGVGLLWYPPVLLAVAAGALFWLSRGSGRRALVLYVVPAYALCVVLTAGVTPQNPGALNWEACGTALIVGLFVAGLLTRRVYVTMAAVVILLVAVWQSDRVETFACRYDVPLSGLVGLAAGLGTMIVYLIFRRKLARAVAVVFALVLAMGAMTCFRPEALDWPLMSSLVLVVIAGAVWWRTQDLLVALVLCVPLVRALYMRSEGMHAWRYVALSFILLAAGTFISLRKGRTQRPSVENTA